MGVVAVWTQDSTDVITAVSIDGVVATRQATQSGIGAGRIYLYYATGTLAGVMTVTATSSASTQINSTAALYDGVDQTTPLDGGSQSSSTITCSGGCTELQATVTSTIDNSWAIGMAGDFTTVSLGGSASSSIRTNASGDIYQIDSTSAISPAGAAILGVTGNAGVRKDIIIAAFRPSAPAVAVVVQSQNPVVWWWDE